MKKYIISVIILLVAISGYSLNFQMDSELEIRYMMDYSITVDFPYNHFFKTGINIHYPEMYVIKNGKADLVDSLLMYENLTLEPKLMITENIFIGVNTQIYVYNYYTNILNWMPFNVGFIANPKIKLFDVEIGFYHECFHPVTFLNKDQEFSSNIDMGNEYYYVSFNNNKTYKNGWLYDMRYSYHNATGIKVRQHVAHYYINYSCHSLHAMLGYRIFGFEIKGFQNKQYSVDIWDTYKVTRGFSIGYNIKNFAIGYEWKGYNYTDQEDYSTTNYKESYIFMKIKSY